MSSRESLTIQSCAAVTVPAIVILHVLREAHKVPFVGTSSVLVANSLQIFHLRRNCGSAGARVTLELERYALRFKMTASDKVGT